MDEQPPVQNPYASPDSAEHIPAQVSWNGGTVSFSFQHSVDDYIAAYTCLNNLDRTPKQQAIAALGFFVIGFTILLVATTTVFAYSSPSAGSRSLFAITLVLGAIFLNLAYCQLPKSRRRQIARSVTQLVTNDSEYLLSQKRFSISPDGLRIVTHLQDTFTHWSLIEKAVETDTHILLLRKLTIHASIPKRVFADRHETERVMHLIRSCLEPRAPSSS